jgi:hypothetical protein
MDWLWDWGGFCFGYREADDLWTCSGKHVGKFHGGEVYARDGSYLGEISGGRLIRNLAKIDKRKASFTPSAERSGSPPAASRAGYAMYTGYKDFPKAESF